MSQADEHLHHIVLQSVRTGERVARINPADWGFSIKQGPGGSFDLERLPAVLATASVLSTTSGSMTR